MEYIKYIVQRKRTDWYKDLYPFVDTFINTGLIVADQDGYLTQWDFDKQIYVEFPVPIRG